MKIFSAVSLCNAFFLLLCLGQATMVFWSVEKTRFHTQRIDLAHQSYERHLLLDSHVHQLFNEYGETLLTGDSDEGAREIELAQLISDDISDIRRLIGAEIEMVGEEEIEELETLAEIETTINSLIRDLERRVQNSSVQPGNVGARSLWMELSAILDGGRGQEFRSLMIIALEEEKEEVEETRAELAAEMNRIWILGSGLAIGAILTAVFIAIAYWRGIHARFAMLMRGVSRMREGVLDEPIGVGGGDEISRVGSLLDELAANIRRQSNALQDRNAALEDAVASRTQELERLLEEARVAEANRRRLLSDVSHELRTPLTIIQGESEVALRGVSSVAEYREALERSRDAAAHTAALIDDLLLISRKEEGHLRLRKQSSDLVEFVADAVSLFPAEVELHIGPKKAPVEADLLRLRQSILALLNNAQIHGGEKIEASLIEKTDCFRIAISDNGRGLSDAEKKHIFQRFFRGSNASTSYQQGTGLGLPIVRSIAEAHGGAAGMEDRDGGGSTFYIDLPKSFELRAVS